MGEVDERRLRHVVGAGDGGRPDPADGGDVHDPAAVLGHPVPVDRPGPHERAALVDGPGLVDGAEVDLHERPGRRVRAGVVDEDVAAAEPLDRLAHGPVGVLLGVGPCRDRMDPLRRGARRHEFVDRHGEVLLPAGRDDHPSRSTPGEGERHRLADPAAPAGHDGDEPFDADLHVHLRLSGRRA